tara:strand:- start:95 stop:604 length:510 start_codon:yes stop_codon:yes gene_type:complete
MSIIDFDSYIPKIDQSAFVAESATLIGNVEVRKFAVIMFGAVLRADRDRIEIGEGSNVQDNVTIHCDPGFPTKIGANVSIGHGAVIHGARVADSSLVGMGAVLLNGSEVGQGALIAAGTTLLEGFKAPPGTLVAGLPGKVKRDLTGEEKQMIANNALHYQELRKIYGQS